MAADQTRLSPAPARVVVACALLLAMGPTVGHVGRPVEAQAQAPPSRIVSLVPSVTELLFAIGAGPKVVGVSSFDEHPADVAGIAKVGGLIDPNIERIFALRPDLVVVYATQSDLRAQLDRAGIAQFPYTNTALGGVAETMRALGRRLGLDASAAPAADEFERRLASVRAAVAGLDRPRVLLVFGHDPNSLRNIDASGRDGFHHDMLEIAGAVNVLADIDRTTVRLSTEEILRLAPDAILDLHYGTAAEADFDAERTIWGRLPAVPAVRTGRVHLLVGDEFVVPGPRIAGATERLAEALHPGVFLNGQSATSHEP